MPKLFSQLDVILRDMVGQSVTFIFSSKSIAVSYLNDASFGEIAKTFNTSVFFINLSENSILNCSQAHKFNITKGSFIQKAPPSFLNSLLRFLSEVNRHANRHLSKSFTFRELRHYPSLISRLRERNSSYVKRFRSSAKHDKHVPSSYKHILLGSLNSLSRYGFLLLGIVLNRVRFLFVCLFASRLIYQLVLFLQKQNVLYKWGASVYPEILKCFESNNIEKPILCFPSNGFNTTETLMLGLANYYRYTSLMIIDNWDNLSSKTILLPKPTYCAVWGAQMLKHAQTIQQFQTSELVVLGTPRFEKYFFPSTDPSQVNSRNRFILFLGSFSPFDEPLFIKSIDDILIKFNDGKSAEEQLLLFYRPHPHGLVSFDLTSANLKYVYWEQKVLFQEESNPAFTKSLLTDPLHTLISLSEFVVGGLTTALLESCFLNKKYVALIHDEPNNVASPKESYENYQHFENISKLSNLMLVDSVETMSSLINDFLNGYVLNHAEQDDPTLSFFYQIPQQTFGQRLENILHQINHS